MKQIYLVPIALFSAVAVIHNTFLAKETANLHTGSVGLDWALAGIFALGIESALWTLIIHQKAKAVKAYTVLLFLLSLLYYGLGVNYNQIVSLIHSEAWTYVEGLLMALIFSVLLSDFLWYLTEVAIEHVRRVEPAHAPSTYRLSGDAIDVITLDAVFSQTESPETGSTVTASKPHQQTVHQESASSETVTESHPKTASSITVSKQIQASLETVTGETASKEMASEPVQPTGSVDSGQSVTDDLAPPEGKGDYRHEYPSPTAHESTRLLGERKCLYCNARLVTKQLCTENA